MSAALVVVGAALLAAACVDAAMPRTGDVCFTSRSVHWAPTGNNDTHPLLNTTGAAGAFHATRMDWVYTEDAAFMQASARAGIPVTAAINAMVPDKMDGPATYDVGRIVDLHGQKLTAPWMRAWGIAPFYGCVNDPNYTAIVFHRAETLLQRGAAALQHDDPHVNAEAVKWKNGGCYCDCCMRKFGPVAHAALPALAPTAAFNYRTYLLSRGGYGKGARKLRLAFEQFQFGSAVAYQDALHIALNARAPAGAPPVVVSCNNGADLWDAVTRTCEFGMGELAAELCTPDRLADMFLTEGEGGKLPVGKKQVVTMPKAHAIGTALKVRTRQAVATVYALGGNMLVPWDIYLPTPNAERFFGNVSDFADLYSVVASHPAPFGTDGAVLLHTWRAGAAVVKVTAPGGNASLTGVYWTVRGAALPANLTTVLHVIDWSWGNNASTVVYPLPTTAGRDAFIVLNVTAATRCGTAARVAAVAELLPDGATRALRSTTVSPQEVGFTVAALDPSAVVTVTCGDAKHP
jgi:hypothetical protein